jgi:hypothetical protein
VASQLNRPLLSLDDGYLSRMDAGVLVSREMMAYIREQGGITPATGAKKDGRLQVVVHVE